MHIFHIYTDLRTKHNKLKKHIYKYTNMHTYIHTYMHACMHACMHAHAYTQTDRQTDRHTYIHTYICASCYLCISPPTYVLMHSHTDSFWKPICNVQKITCLLQVGLSIPQLPRNGLFGLFGHQRLRFRQRMGYDFVSYDLTADMCIASLVPRIAPSVSNFVS